MYGLRYEIHVGGPAFLMARWSHVNSERFPIDPTKGGAAMQLGKKSVSLNLYDVNLAINLTGEKSFHHIIPVINLGAGIAIERRERAMGQRLPADHRSRERHDHSWRGKYLSERDRRIFIYT